jgi:hypothetical protein
MPSRRKGSSIKIDFQDGFNMYGSQSKLISNTTSTRSNDSIRSDQKKEALLTSAYLVGKAQAVHSTKIHTSSR